MIKKKYVYSPFTDNLDAVANLSETIAFGDLSDATACGNYQVIFNNLGEYTGSSNLEFNAVTKDLYAYSMSTSYLVVTGWTPGWCLYAGASQQMTGEDGYTYTAGTDTLNVPNIISSGTIDAATFTSNITNTQVVYSDSGTLAGDSGFTYAAGTDTLTVAGALIVNTNALAVNALGLGRVGIGLVDPSQPLHVVVGANEMVLMVGSATEDQSYGLNIQAGTSATDYALSVNSQGGSQFLTIDGVGNIDCYDGTIVTTGTGTFGDLKIPAMSLATPTYSTVNNWFNLFTSAGRLTGGTITDATGEEVNVAAGTGVIRIADDDVSQVKFFDWEATNGLSVPTNTVRYIGIDYNTGTEAITVEARTTRNWDLDTEFPLGSVINQAGTLYIMNDPWWVGDGLTNVIERFQSEGTIRDNYIGGLILGTATTNTTRKPTLTLGTVWSRLTEFAITAKNCLTGDTFYGFYRDGGSGWTRTAAKTDIDDFYDDNSGTLQALGLNKYVNFWVFVEVDTVNSGQLMVIYPQTQYNTAAAAEAGAMPVFPSIWYKHGILVGRIIVKQGVTAPYVISSAFSTMFTPALAADHGNLSGLEDDDHAQYWLAGTARSGNFSTSGTLTAGYGVFNGTSGVSQLTLYYTGGQTGTIKVDTNGKMWITAYSGNIDFSNENLTTTGLLTAGSATINGTITLQNGETIVNSTNDLVQVHTKLFEIYNADGNARLQLQNNVDTIVAVSHDINEAGIVHFCKTADGNAQFFTSAVAGEHPQLQVHGFAIGAANYFYVDNVQFLPAGGDPVIGASDGALGIASGTNLYMVADNQYIYFGAGEDSRVYYDGTQTKWDLNVVGTGGLVLDMLNSSGGNVLTLDTDELINGNGFLINHIKSGSGLASGELLHIDYNVEGAISRKTGNLAHIIGDIYVFGLGAGTYTDDYDLLALERISTINNSSVTQAAYGSVLRLTNTSTQTAGTMDDQVKVLEITQAAMSTGDAIWIDNNGSGYGINLTDGNMMVALDEKIYFGDTGVYLFSDDNSFMDYVADGMHRFNVDVKIGADSHIDWTLSFGGDHNVGMFTWMEDEDYFEFNDLVRTTHQSMSLAQGGIQSMSNDGAVAVTNSYLRVVGYLGAVVLDTDPAIADGLTGQIIVIEGTNDSNTVTIADNCNTQLAGDASVVLGLNDTIMLIFNGTDWLEISRSAN